MANGNPTVYGFCGAGCKRRVPNYNEFQKSATYIEQYLSNGGATVEAISKYKIRGSAAAEKITQISTPPFNVNGSAVVVNGSVWLVMGGEGNTGVIQYFPETQSYSSPHSIDIDTNYPACAAVGDNIYIFFGIESGEVIEFNTKTGAYNVVWNMSVSLNNTQVCSIGTDIYIVGGDISGGDMSNKIYKFDTSQVLMEEVKELPCKLSYSTVSAVDKMLYIFGGHDTTGAVNKIWRWDTAHPDSEVVELVDTLPTRILLETTTIIWGIDIASVAIGNDIYLFGGKSAMGATEALQFSSWILKFNTETEILTYCDTFLPKGLCNCSAAAVGSKIYLFGGEATDGINNAIYEFQSASFDVDLTLNYYSNGETRKKKIPVTIYDEYKDEFIFEIVALKMLDTEYNTLFALAYECNGKRSIEYISGKQLSVSNATLTVSNAEKLFFYNSDAEILADSGADGKSVFIRYSVNADGTDFTEEWIKGQKYIGVGTALTAPTDKSGYEWSLFSGENSILPVTLSNVTEIGEETNYYTATATHSASEIKSFVDGGGTATVTYEADGYTYTLPIVSFEEATDGGYLANFTITFGQNILAVQINESKSAIVLHSAISTDPVKAVSYEPQDLTKEQKAQARKNIGAVSPNEIPKGITEDRVNELIAEALGNISNAEDISV